MRILIPLLIILTSCATQKRCEQKYGKITKDSTVIHDSIRYTDSTVIKTVKRDSVVIREAVEIKDSMPCANNGKYMFKRGGDEFYVTVKDGEVYFSAKLAATESHYESIINDKEREIKSLQSKQDTHVVVKELPVPKVPWYMHLWDWLLKVLAAIGAFYLLTLLCKYFLKTICG